MYHWTVLKTGSIHYGRVYDASQTIFGHFMFYLLEDGTLDEDAVGRDARLARIAELGRHEALNESQMNDFHDPILLHDSITVSASQSASYRLFHRISTSQSWNNTRRTFLQSM